MRVTIISLKCSCRFFVCFQTNFQTMKTSQIPSDCSKTLAEIEGKKDTIYILKSFMNEI